MIGPIEGLAAVLALTGENAATFADDLETVMNDSADAVDKAVAIMNEGVSRQFVIAMNDIKVSGQKIGAILLPIFKNIIDKLIPIIEKIQEWVEANPKLIEQLLKIGGQLMIGGAILVGLSMLVKAIMAINTALIMMQALGGPAGWAQLVTGIGIAGFAITGMNEIMKGLSPDEGAKPPPDPGIIYRLKDWLTGIGVGEWKEVFTDEGEGGAKLPPDPGIIYRLKDWLTGIDVGEWKQSSSAPSPVSGPTSINVHVEGSVMSERDLTEVIRRELTTTKARNFSLGLG